MDIVKEFTSKKGHNVIVKESNGEIFIDAETAAKGLGFTTVSNGTEYIRWNRINKYIKDFSEKTGQAPNVKKGDYITEPTFYLLAMKANNEVARIFQTWISVDVLPTLRKQGAYISDTITPAQIKQAKKYLTEKGLKSLFKNTDEENIISEYRLARQAAGDKKQFDKLALELLQKRPLGANSNKLIYKIHKKQLKALTTQNKKLQAYIKNIEPADEEYSIVNYHPFSVNMQYKSTADGIRRTDDYNEWINAFPIEDLPNIDNIDFDKPVDLFLKFDHDKRFDVTNFSKSAIDRMCKYWGKNDRLIQLKSCVTNKYTSKEEGKIFIYIRQGVDIS